MGRWLDGQLNLQHARALAQAVRAGHVGDGLRGWMLVYVIVHECGGLGCGVSVLAHVGCLKLAVPAQQPAVLASPPFCHTSPFPILLMLVHLGLLGWRETAGPSVVR